MASLNDFSPEEKLLLAGLPYRIGIYVSDADDVEGDLDDKREARALEHCIAGIARFYKDKPFTASVMQECLRMRAQWPEWRGQVFTVTGDARKAVALLKNKIPEHNLKNFRAALMEIATAVAEASGEFAAFEEGDEEGFFGKILSRLSGLSPDDPDHPMNVSAAESGVLSELAEALKI